MKQLALVIKERWDATMALVDKQRSHNRILHDEFEDCFIELPKHLL